MPPVARCRMSTYLSPNGVSGPSDGAGRFSLLTQHLAEWSSCERLDRAFARAPSRGMATGQAARGHGGAEQRVECAGRALRDAFEIVAALEHRDDRLAERAQPRRKGGITSRVELHLRQWIVLVGVVAGRDENHV